MRRVNMVVSFDPGEFEEAFPEIAIRNDLNKSDKVRVALGLPARQAAGGAPKGNKYAVGNKGRWATATQMGWGQYIDRLAQQVADEMGIAFVDYGEDYIKHPAGLWAQQRNINTFRRYYYNSSGNSVKVWCDQTAFDEDKFLDELKKGLQVIYAAAQ